MSTEERKRVSWLVWPFVALWRLLTLILEVTGRLIAGILGLVLMAVGLVLIVTVIAAPLGIPLMVIGLLLTIRAIF
ncbi:MAG: hypothetical protein ACLFWD_10355 [Anaerolineales bacterium]